MPEDETEDKTNKSEMMLDQIDEDNNTFKIIVRNKKSSSFHLDDSQRERRESLLK